MKKILFVEDDEWLAEHFIASMDDTYVCQSITNAYEAIESIDTFHPDCLVLDVFLAGSNGLALLHEMQSYQDTARIPVVICSLASASLSLETMRAYGVRAILDKQTVTPLEMKQAIHEVLSL